MISYLKLNKVNKCSLLLEKIELKHLYKLGHPVMLDEAFQL